MYICTHTVEPQRYGIYEYYRQMTRAEFVYSVPDFEIHLMMGNLKKDLVFITERRPLPNFSSQLMREYLCG